MVIDEDDQGVAVYRKVLIGHLPRGPNGNAMCMWCHVNEADGRTRAFCSDACRHAHTRSMRPPKARFLPCPVCRKPCIKCWCIPCQRPWKWGPGRIPIWKANLQRVHTSEGNPTRGTTPTTETPADEQQATRIDPSRP